MKTSPTKRIKKVQAFRFPKGIWTVILPSLPPFSWNEEAEKVINKTLGLYTSLPKNAKVRLEYSYPNGVVEVKIYKHSPLPYKKKK